MRPRLTVLLAWLARQPRLPAPRPDVTTGPLPAGEVRPRSAGAIYRRPAV